MTTPPKSNIAPEKGWLEDDPFLLGQMAHFQRRFLKAISQKQTFMEHAAYNVGPVADRYTCGEMGLYYIITPINALKIHITPI